MGVNTGWDILAPAEEKGVLVSSLRGCTLAVDFSIWIAELTQAVKELHTVFLRNLFYRILGFMSEGIKLVIVIDGKAPTLKLDVMQDRQRNVFGSANSDINPDRPWMANIVKKCAEMLQGLGLPLVYSKGEAEAMCAHLNAAQHVDGCLSNDSDYFCYGGRVLYRNLRKISKGYVVDRVTMTNVNTDSGLNQRDLIALALLIGCDYNKQGLQSVGKEKALELVKHLKAKGYDVLDRLIGWGSNQTLISINKDLSVDVEHSPHCSRCDHLGRISAHKKTGCSTCMTQSDCMRSCDKICTCDWHKQKRLLQDNKVEIKIWRKAMENTSFPNKEIIAEFLAPASDSHVDVSLKQINMMQLLQILPTVIHKDRKKLLDKLIPCYILQQLYHPALYTTHMFLPVRIIRQCKFKEVACYEVSWDKSDKNNWMNIEHHSSSVTVKIEKGLVKTRYPALVSKFEEEKAANTPKCKKRKRKTDTEAGASAGGLERFLTVKRRLDYSVEAAREDLSTRSCDDSRKDCAIVDLSKGPHNMQGDGEQVLSTYRPVVTTLLKDASPIITIDTDESSEDELDKTNIQASHKRSLGTKVRIHTIPSSSSTIDTGESSDELCSGSAVDLNQLSHAPLASSSDICEQLVKQNHRVTGDKPMSTSGLEISSTNKDCESTQTLRSPKTLSNVQVGLNDNPTMSKSKIKCKISKPKTKKQTTLEGFFKKSK